MDQDEFLRMRAWAYGYLRRIGYETYWEDIIQEMAYLRIKRGYTNRWEHLAIDAIRGLFSSQRNVRFTSFDSTHHGGQSQGPMDDRLALKEVLAEIEGRVSPRDYQIFTDYLWHGLTRSEMMEKYGVSRESIQRVLDRVRKVKAPLGF